MPTFLVSGTTTRSRDGSQFALGSQPSLTFSLKSSLQITDAVHANGSHIFAQLWALGRVAEGDVLRKTGNYSVVGPSAVAMEGYETPRALTIEEIKDYVNLYATAAENAVRKAGFDGVEIHSASGFLPDQFLQTTSNQRTDEYGGSVENRLRFVLEVVDAVVKAVGANRVGIRISPYMTMNGKR
jgi:NADPH2 dehydrogenase